MLPLLHKDIVGLCDNGQLQNLNGNLYCNVNLTTVLAVLNNNLQAKFNIQINPNTVANIVGLTTVFLRFYLSKQLF